MERRHPVSSITPSCFLDLFPYLSFFSAIGKEAGRQWEIMWEEVGCIGVTTSFIALRCNNRGGKVAGLHRRGKKAQYDAPSTLKDMATISKTGTMIGMGSAKPSSQLRATQSNQSEG
jgi:hypothetical protein